MATVSPTISRRVGTNDGSVMIVTWVLTTADSDGAPVELVEWADRTTQVAGTFGGATCQIQGSNDGSGWSVLTNAAGATALSHTAAGIASCIELPRYMRPSLVIVGAGASLTITMIARRANPLRT